MQNLVLVALLVVVLYNILNKNNDTPINSTNPPIITSLLNPHAAPFSIKTTAINNTFRNEVDVLNQKNHVGMPNTNNLKYFENDELPYLNKSNPITFKWDNETLTIFEFNENTQMVNFRTIPPPFETNDIFKIRIFDNNVFKITNHGTLFHYKFEDNKWTIVNRQLGTGFQRFKEIIRDPDHRNHLFALETNGNIVYFKTFQSPEIINKLENNHRDFTMHTLTIPHDLYHTYLPFIYDH
jgi:hypothetical protein